MQRTSCLDGISFNVEAVYAVSGSGDPLYPYHNNLASLKDAVNIAKTYGGIGTSKGAGRVTRNLNVYYPSSVTRHISFRTHEWFVFADGRIENTGWGKGRQIKSPARVLRESLEGARSEATREDAIRMATRGVDWTILIEMLNWSRKCGIRLTFWDPNGDPSKTEEIARARALSWLDNVVNESCVSVSQEIRDKFADAAGRYVVPWPTAYAFQGQEPPQDQLLQYAITKVVEFERSISQVQEATPDIFETLSRLRNEIDILVEAAAHLPGYPTADVSEKITSIKRYLHERLCVAEDVVGNLPQPKTKGLVARLIDSIRTT